MNCVNCGCQVQSGFLFCPRCGRKVERVCSACGFACEPDFRFCPKCGAAVGDPVEAQRGASSSSPPGGSDGTAGADVAARMPVVSERAADDLADADRRIVTVLFADMSGFTTLSEYSDPEMIRSLQNELFACMRGAVEEFGGYVDKFVGDAMLALFGAPVALEDAPERALGAAMKLLRCADGLEARVRLSRKEPLALHIGVNTGPVVTGNLGSGGAVSYSVTGDTVNTAQRLQSLAASGEILVGPLTYRLSRHAFAFESLGELVLRGRVGRVLVHRLTGPLAAPRAARGIEALGLSSPMIGRDVELARLLGCMDLALSDTPQLVRVVGEAGIGKSRLVEEFIARLRDEERFADLAVRRVACSPLGEQSYGVLAAILRSAYGIGADAGEQETREILVAALAELGLSSDDIGRLLPLYLYVFGLDDRSGELPVVEPQQLKRQIFFSIRTLFEHRLAAGPLLVVVEDIHRADAVSVEALHFLADRLDRKRLMLLVTQRPAAETDALDTGHISRVTLRLKPLDEESVRRFLDSMLGAQDSGASQGLARHIFARAGGVPFFVEEIVRGLVENGTIRRDGQSWTCSRDAAAVEIPAGIQAMLLSRFDRLPARVRRLAQDAAVVGPQFPIALLRRLTGEPEQLEAGLDLLLDTEIIEEVANANPLAPASYRFTHSLLQEVIYQNILNQRRVEMHGRTGAVLESLRGTSPAQLSDLTTLGHHFSLSLEKAKGARYLMAAGDRARSSFANDDALRYYQSGLSALESIDGHDTEKLVLRERIADLCGPSGRRDLAHEHYEAVLQALKEAGDTVGVVRIMRKIGCLLCDAGKRVAAERQYREALELAQTVDAPIERALLLQERGRMACRIGDHASAVKWADEALAQAAIARARDRGEDSTEVARAVAESLNTKGVALARLGTSREAIRAVEKSIEVATENGLLKTACRGYTNLGVLYASVDPARAAEICDEGLKLARRIGDLGLQARMLANFAVATCTFTDRCAEEGIPAAREAADLDRALDQREHLAVPLTVLGQVHQCRGETDLAARYYGEALDVALESGEPQLLFPCYDGLATLNLDLDRLPEAERYFALAQDVCARHGVDPESLVVLPFLD